MVDDESEQDDQVLAEQVEDIKKPVMDYLNYYPGHLGPEKGQIRLGRV